MQLISHIGQSRSSHFGQRAQDALGQFGYICDMADSTNNIRAIRLQRGLTLQQLAALTKNPDPSKETDLSTISKLELGKRKLTQEWMTRIGDALGVDPADLIGVAAATKPARKVPLIGKIPAGNWRAAIEDATDLILTTKGGPNTFALVPEGDSMDQVVQPGAVIFIDPDDRAMIDGKYYAMLRPGGETTFKRYRTDPPRLDPCSTNPEHKTMLMGDEPLTTIGRVVGQESDL